MAHQHKLHPTPELSCPKCHTTLDGATNADAEEPAAPSDGDLSVCLYCEAVLVFKGIEGSPKLGYAIFNGVLDPETEEEISRCQVFSREFRARTGREKLG